MAKTSKKLMYLTVRVSFLLPNNLWKHDEVWVTVFVTKTNGRKYGDAEEELEERQKLVHEVTRKFQEHGFKAETDGLLIGRPPHPPRGRSGRVKEIVDRLKAGKI